MIGVVVLVIAIQRYDMRIVDPRAPKIISVLWLGKIQCHIELPEIFAAVP